MNVIKRVSLTLASLVLVFALAACGGGEAEQAKSFQAFLVTQILDKKGIRISRPTDEQRASFGRFAADYDVILKFNDTMSDAMSKKLPEVMRRGNILTISQLVERRGDVAAARDALAEMSKTLETALADANAARAKLNQPDSLKPVYDRAFSRLVTNPATVVSGIWPALDKAFGQTLEFGDFLAANSAKFEIVGPLARTEDPKLLAEFNKHAEAMRAMSGGVNEAQNAMRRLINGE